jgi:Putative polyhydroxyalkanoic acid system protein (PHA_gran_rgn)
MIATIALLRGSIPRIHRNQWLIRQNHSESIMLEISTLVSHALGRKAALDRIHQMVDFLTERFPQQVHQVASQWNDNRLSIRFAAYGYLVHWEVIVREGDVCLKGEIPDSARAFRSKIEQTIVDRLETVLEQPTVDANYQSKVA